MRVTAVFQGIAFSTSLLIPVFISKLIAIVFVNIFNTGWYPILKGQLYSALPGQSASIMAIEAVTTPLAKLLPLVIGLLADQFGLDVAIWLLVLGSITIFIGVPRKFPLPLGED